jgi:shikimate dehydrogenase
LVELLGSKLHVAATAAAWQEKYPLPADTALVVNATSIGQEDDDALVPLKLDTLGPKTIVADVTVNPPRTRLLVEAGQLGCPTIDGLEIFVAQTAICLARWTGVDPDRTVMREAVEEFLLL